MYVNEHNLPVFPFFHDSITEDRFERCIERMMDIADKQMLACKCTYEQYQQWVKALNAWAKNVTVTP